MMRINSMRLQRIYNNFTEILDEFNKFMGDRLSELVKNNRRDLLSLYDE
ncbi:hypothetical protein [Clostridium sp. B9]